VIEAAPLERIAAVDFVNPVDKRTKGPKPCKAREEIDWVVHEAAGEGKKPNYAEDDRPGGDDFSVDLAAERASMLLVMNVKEVTSNTEDDCGADELRKAEDEGKQAAEDHLDCCW